MKCSFGGDGGGVAQSRAQTKPDFVKTAATTTLETTMPTNVMYFVANYPM